MTKHLLFLVAVTGFIFANNGCTSKKTDEEQQVVENADVEKIEADGLNATAQPTDPSLESALGEAPKTSTTDTAATSAASPAPTLDDSSLNLDMTEASKTPPTPVTDTASAVTETPVSPIEATAIDTAALSASSGSINSEATAGFSSTSESKTSMGSSGVTPSKTTASPLKKVSDVKPYQAKDGGWINTVYITRSKEKLLDISMKIYGVDKSKELKKIAENSYLKSRSAKAGDKIYYSSPNRPDDSSKTMLFYEDMGMVPEIYVAKKGESLIKVSKTLLGYDNAWREVWTSNGMESKTALKDGETIRYWKAADASATQVNSSTPPGGATLIDQSQAPAATAQTTPPMGQKPVPSLPPPPENANAKLPPPPSNPMGNASATPPPTEPPTAATTDSLPPPPPADLAPPPPPPPEAVAATPTPKKKVNLDEAAAAEEEGGLDSDTMMSMGAVGVLVAMMAFVIIRKKKQKAQMMNGEMNA